MVNAKQLLNTRIDEIVKIASTYLQKEGYPASPTLFALSFDPEYLKRLKRKQDFLFPWHPFYKPETIKAHKILKFDSVSYSADFPNFNALLIKKSKVLRLSKRSKEILTFLETHNFEKSPMAVRNLTDFEIQKLKKSAHPLPPKVKIMTEAVWLNYQIILQATKLKRRLANSPVSPEEACLLMYDFMMYVACSDIALDYPDRICGEKVKEGKKNANVSRKKTTDDRNALLLKEFNKIYKQNPYAKKTWLAKELDESFNWESNEVKKIGVEQLRRIIRGFVTNK